jgi:hypothetical protein
MLDPLTSEVRGLVSNLMKLQSALLSGAWRDDDMRNLTRSAFYRARMKLAD